MAALKGGEDAAKYIADLLNRLGTPGTLRVGYLEDATYPDGTSVALVAAVNEFGSPAKGIPPRPTFRPMIAAKSGEWGPALAGLLAKGATAEEALLTLGDGIVGQLQDSIRNFSGTPDSPVTDLLKFRFPMGGQTFDDVLRARVDVANGVTAPVTKPLTHTGNMENSVGREVTMR